MLLHLVGFLLTLSSEVQHASEYILKWGKTFWTKCKQLEYETTDGVFRWAVMLFIITVPFNHLKFSNY